MTTHTAGPWTLGDWPGGYVVETETTNRLFTIQPLAAEGREAHEANARLIAAAPDLLAALEALAGHLDCMCNDYPDDVMNHETGDGYLARQSAKAAITKAKGIV